MIDPNDPGESALAGGADGGVDAEINVDTSVPASDEINGHSEAGEGPDNAPPADTEAPQPAELPAIEGEELARFALPPKSNEEEDLPAEATAGTLLPVVLIVIGVVVSIVLIGAVVSALLKSSLVSGGAAPPPPAPATPEQAPLNDVQAQRTAQMDW